MVAGFKALQIGEEFRGRFLGDNARRLLGL